MYKLIVALCLLITSAAFAANMPSRNPNPLIQKNFKVWPFNVIRASGDIDIEITTANRYQLTFDGRLRSFERTKFDFQNSTLIINAPIRACRWIRPKIKITMPSLAQFNYWAGTGNIKIHSLQSRAPLSLDIRGNPKIDISGNILPGKMIIQGNTQLSIYWINACEFYLTAMGHARICLAGNVGTFAATASQWAWINARYLHARRGFVRSCHHARIDLQSSCNLSTFATPCSSIYYYQRPYLQAPFLQGGGAVIPMVPMCYPPCDDCNCDCCKNTWH